MTPELFTPITLRDLTIKNRIWIAPMCQYSAVDGKVGDWHLVHLGSFASGGAGLVIAEATGVLPEGRISVGCPGLWSDEVAESWRKPVEFAHSMNAKMGIQLAHAGRKGSRRHEWVGGNAEAHEGGWQVVGPSANAYEGYPTAHAMTLAGIAGTVQAFADAARRAVAVGFDVVEIHAAHGYLLHEFLSPLTNERTDEYGGTFDNRVRMLMEVIAAVRSAVPAGMPVFVRISATDWVDGGWDLEQSVKLAKLMKAAGVDMVHVSTAGLVHHQKIEGIGPHFQVPFAAAIREQADIPTIAVGMITDPAKANAVIADGQADAVCIARAAMRNPRWPYFAAEALGYRIDLPNQLQRSRTI